jgi:hypothetical protein
MTASERPQRQNAGFLKMSFDGAVDLVRGAELPDAGSEDGAVEAPELLTSVATGEVRNSFTDGGGSNGAIVAAATTDALGADAMADSVVTCRPAMKSR